VGGAPACAAGLARPGRCRPRERARPFTVLARGPSSPKHAHSSASAAHHATSNAQHAARSTQCQTEKHTTHQATRKTPRARQVKAVLAELLPRQGLAGLPLYALGASSGGAFVLALAAELPLAGVCAQLMGLPRLWSYEAEGVRRLGAWPPTAFVVMPRDALTGDLLATNAEFLRGAVRTRARAHGAVHARMGRCMGRCVGQCMRGPRCARTGRVGARGLGGRADGGGACPASAGPRAACAAAVALEPLPSTASLTPTPTPRAARACPRRCSARSPCPSPPSGWPQRWRSCGAGPARRRRWWGRCGRGTCSSRTGT
jgi:hypothetical protein